MNRFHLFLLLGTIVSAKLSDLSFGGNGKALCDGDGGCEYQFSTGFQNDICSGGNMLIKENRWCAQGVSVSQNGDYIVRPFYEGGKEDSYDYVVVSVIKKGGAVRYSNILVQQPTQRTDACHAGDIVLSEIDGVYWFLIACSRWIMAFNENSIYRYKEGKKVNGRTFYWRVSRKNVKEIKREKGMSLSWISRNQGTVDQFWTGQYHTSLCLFDCNGDINLRLITIDVHDSWEVTNVEEYSVTDDQPFLLNKVQGATRVGGNVYLSRANVLLKCPITKKRVGRCEELCNFKLRGLSFIQGAEVDNDGNLWIGSEFGLLGDRARWFKLDTAEADWSKKRGFVFTPECLTTWKRSCKAENEPYNGIEMEPEEPSNQIYTEWSYSTVGLIALFGAAMFASGMSLMVYCSNKKPVYSLVKTVSSDEETDII